MITVKPAYYAFLLFIFLLQLKPLSLSAQDSKENVLAYADVLPSFKGDYMEYLRDNVEYPIEAAKNNIQGTVYIEAIIDNVGKVAEVVIKKDPGGGLGEEAARVVRAMPDWEPAEQNGKKVSIRITIPIKFILEDTNKKKKKWGRNN